MKISQQFTVARPLDEVWAFLQNVPAVARCMPGAELTQDKGDGLYAGKVTAKLGPFAASFEGDAEVSADPATHSGHVEGKGVDKRGGSRTRMIMDYRLAAVEGGTEVSVDADVTLAGAIAQFGRTGLLQETANILVRDFAGALEAELAAPAAPAQPVPAAEAPPAAKPGPPPAAQPSGETATGAETVRQTAAAAAAEARSEGTPPQRPIRAGSIGLRALWGWLRSLVRGLFSGSGGKTG